MSNKTAVLSVMVASLIAMTGCADLIGGIKKGSKPKAATVQDVEAAQAKGDYEALKGYCMGAKRVATADAGCTAAVDLLAAKKDMATLKEICHGQKQASPYKDWRNRRYACKAVTASEAGEWQAELDDCAKVPTIFERNRAHFRTQSDDNYLMLGKAVVKCGLWDYLWTTLVHFGNGRNASGIKLLKALDADGKPVLAELMKYLEAHKDSPFAFKNGGHATGHVLSWLRQSGKAGDSCRFLPYAQKASDKSVGHWLHFFAETKCVKAAPLAVRELANERAARRRQACAVLGKIGGKKHVRKLKILAKSDPTFKTKGFVKIFWVRDACRAAAGQIMLRN